MAKLHYIGKSDYLVQLKCNSSVEELCLWYNNQSIIQLDTETNVTDSIVSRKLILIQFGSLDGSEVFVVQWSFLTETQKETVRNLLRDSSKLKIAHNASFEYQICLKEGVILDNIWDTMVIEQCLYAGYDFDLRFFALAATLLRRYQIDVSKEQQSEFGDDIITDEKLIYAATDVVHLGRLYEDQRNDLIKEDLIQLGDGIVIDSKIEGIGKIRVSENEALLAFADMEYNGMGFLPEPWRDNIAKAEPIVQKATADLSEILLKEPYLSLGKELMVKAKLVDSDGNERKVDVPAILDSDIITVNWNSSPQCLKVLQIIFPDLEKASSLELKKYLQDNDPNAPQVNNKGKSLSVTSKEFLPYLTNYENNKFTFIKLLLNKDIHSLEQALISNFRQELIDRKFLLPKDTVTVNWNSNDAKLSIFKWFNPNVENTDADTVENNIHLPFFQVYKKYNNANSLLTKYGESFIEKHVDIDGRVRTRYNTVLSTGRVSSSSPNVQQIPKNALPEERQKDYRKCFYPGIKDWKLIDADFVSQELCLIGTLSNDPIFLDALSTGKDLHSVSAETVLGDEWKNATEEGCAYYKVNENGEFARQKCKCHSHKKMRQNMKAISFGLIYGLSPKGLAADLQIPLEEAESLFQKYFIAFPNIGGLLDSLGNYGTDNGFIRTVAPFRRKRYFPYWKGAQTPKNLLGQIDRASKNTPIQGSSSDIVKIALIMLRKWINSNNLRSKVQLFLQLHDEIAASCHESMAETVSNMVTICMERAAEIVLNNTLLKAEVEISDTW